MKLRNRVSCDFIRVMVIFVILFFKFNYGLCNQETGDNSDTISTADSVYNDIMLNDETFKFYDNVDELTANLLNDTVTEYSNDEEEIDEEKLKKLMENYDKAYTNETWIVVPKDGDIVETIQEIVEEFETGPNKDIVIVTQDDDNVGISRKQHDDLQFGFEINAGTTVEVIDITTENNKNDFFDEDVGHSTEREVNEFEVRSDELDAQTTEIGEVEYRNEEPEFSTRSEIQDSGRSEDFEPQTTENLETTTSTESNVDEFRNEDLELHTTEKEELLEYITNKFESENTKPESGNTNLDKHVADLDEIENDDLLIDELDPIIIELPKPEAPKLSYEDYTTEEETTTHIADIETLIGHKIYLHEPEVTIDYNVMIVPESTTPKPVLVPEVFPTTEDFESLETTPNPSILQKISSYMYGIFNYRFAKADGRNFEIDPDDFSTEIFDDFVTTSYNTDRKRIEEQSIIEIEKILDPEVKNEFIKDIVIDKSPDVFSIFKKPDESNIINRGLVVLDSDNVDVEKFRLDKINRDGKSSAEYEEDIIDNNLYSNPVQNSRINHMPPVEIKHEDKTISEIEKIIDPEIQNEFIKDIPQNSDHTADIPIIDIVKVMDNTDGDTEIHVTERNIEESGRHIHDENKIEAINNPDLHLVTHENIHIEQANDTRTEDRTKVEIETADIDRVEVQHVLHKEDESDQQIEKKTEHVTIDEPGLHMENHETIETTKTKNGDVTDTEDIITKDLGNVHVVEKIKIHEDNKNVYEQLLKKEEVMKKNKNKIDELKKEIDILKEDIKRPNELIAYEAELLKKTGQLPDKIELIASYLNNREHQLYENSDDVGLKRYLLRLTKERELDILKFKKDKLKKQLFEDFKEYMSAEQKFGIRLDDEIEKSVEKFDEESKSSSSISSKSKSASSDEQDDSKEESEERVWNSFISQARLAAEERGRRREEEVLLLERVLNDDNIPQSIDHITIPTFVPTTPVPVLFPDIDKESQIILLETLVRLPIIENEKDLRNLPVTTDLPINTNVPITEKISIEIDEIEKIVDEQSHIVKVIDKRVLLHNNDNKLEIDETINTQSGDTQVEVHNKRVQNIDDKTRSRILEVLMPKLREISLKKQNSTRQGEGRSLSDKPVEEIVHQETDDSPTLDEENDSVITNEALRTVVEGVELTSEIARSVDNFRSPIEKITEILTATDQTIKTKTPNELADEIGRAEEILGVEENKIVAEIAELELVGVNLAVILFCILCTFLILVITIIFFLRKSKRLSGLNFIPV